MAARDYVAVPIHYSKRRNKNGMDSDSPDDSSFNASPSDDEKHDKSSLFLRLKDKKAVVVVTSLCFIALVIYVCLPNDQSSLIPRQSLSEKHLLPPTFKVDTSIIDDIPRIDQIGNSQANNIDASNITIVYFVSHGARSLCELLLSIASVISSTTSLNPQRYNIIVFMPSEYESNAVDVHKIADKMNFKISILKYDSNHSRPTSKLKYIVNTLAAQNTHSDSVLYLDPNAFVLRDLSVLHSAVTTHDGYHFGGIWSFDTNTEPCLSALMLVIDLQDLAKRNIDYKKLSLCNARRDQIRQSNAVNLNGKHMSAVRDLANEFGIVAFPWWYAMQYKQFKAQSEQLPFIMDVSGSQNENINDEWLSIRRKGIDSCLSVTA